MTFGIQESFGNSNNNLTYGNGHPLGALNLKNMKKHNQNNNGTVFDNGFKSEDEGSNEGNKGSQNMSSQNEEEIKNDLSVEILNNFNIEQAPNTP